jgi:hypothetical protein
MTVLASVDVFFYPGYASESRRRSGAFLLAVSNWVVSLQPDQRPFCFQKYTLAYTKET